MSKSAADHFNSITIEALSMPPQERRELLMRLLKSLDEVQLDDDENLLIALERLEKVRQGKAELIPYEQIRERVRTKYGI